MFQKDNCDLSYLSEVKYVFLDSTAKKYTFKKGFESTIMFVWQKFKKKKANLCPTFGQGSVHVTLKILTFHTVD